MMGLSLFGGRLAPLTYSVGFLNAPVGEVAKAMMRFFANSPEKAFLVELQGDFYESLLALQPLRIGYRPRILLAGTAAPGWTALFDGDALGQGVGQNAETMAGELKVRGYYMACSPPIGKTDGKLGGRHFRVLGPEGVLGIVRSVDLIENNRGRWYFEVSGEAQSFEDVEAYERRRKTERLTEEMLVDYAAAVGLSPWEESFYTGPYCVIDGDVPPSEGVSLMQARQRLGLPID